MNASLTIQTLVLTLAGALAAMYLHQRTAVWSFLKPMRFTIIIVTLFYFCSIAIALYTQHLQKLWIIVASCALVVILVCVRLAYIRWDHSTPRRDSWRQHRVLVFVVMMALLGPGAMVLGRYLGHADSKDLLARLELIRPDVLAMPVEDRVVLVRLGLRCNASREPLEVDAVLRCLRGAAASNDDEAKALEKLIEFSGPKQSI